ncbi:MAG: lysine exporter LysO family protein [Bacteroidales bacterium]|nr:lysine exporter LysO family protein [Bacteroidales bacterium]
MRSSLYILGAFTVGVLLAIFNLIPYGEELVGYSKYLLYLLMFMVGVSLGLDKTVVSTIKSQKKRYYLLPLFTMAGTFAGAVAAFLIISAISGNLSLVDSLSVSAGFGYYSLSSIFLNEAKGAELGTIALAANILRELITILFAPYMVKLFGKLAPISSGGATTMDTTLPVIQKSCGNEYVPLSVFHGVVVDFSVPFFLTLFLSL